MQKYSFFTLVLGGVLVGAALNIILLQHVRALSTAETTMKSKTIIFHALQNTAVIPSGSSVTTSFAVYIGETDPIVTNAYLEVEGVTKQGNQTITIDLKEEGSGSFPTLRAQAFNLDSSGKDNHFTLLYQGSEAGNDLTSYLAGVITEPGQYTFEVKVEANGAAVSLINAKLILTYAFTPPTDGGNVPNSATAVFHALQNTAVIPSGSSVTTSFAVYIGETDPIVTNAYLEVEGVTKQGSQTITIDLKEEGSGSFPTLRAQAFNLDSSGKDNHFTLLYQGSEAGNDLTSYLAGVITEPGQYTFEVKVEANGAAVSLIGARLVIVYQFTQATGGYVAVGNIISPTFDTYAVNGASYNSVLWKGTKPLGTRVRLQLATSDSASGPFSFIGGATCTGADYFEPSADAAATIRCFTDFNNKRFFRYKAILCSSTDCSTSGAATPQVDDVIVNWSP